MTCPPPQLPAAGVGLLRPAGGQVAGGQERRVGVRGVPAARPALPGARPRRRRGHLPHAARHAVHHARQHTGESVTCVSVTYKILLGNIA